MLLELYKWLTETRRRSRSKEELKYMLNKGLITSEEYYSLIANLNDDDDSCIVANNLNCPRPRPRSGTIEMQLPIDDEEDDEFY